MSRVSYAALRGARSCLQQRQVVPSGEKRRQALPFRFCLRLFLRLAVFSVPSIGNLLSGQGEPARRHGVGEVFPELVGLGGAPVGGDADGLEGDYLPVVQAPLPEPVRPGAVQGERAALVQEAVVQRGGLILGLREQEEAALLESVLGGFGVR